ncbi:MAG: helix-turn-helix domain-containing protein [Cetobacterium sp.]
MINKEYLKEKRVAKGYTQIELAKEFGYGTIIANNWENGKRVPKTETIIKLCKLLDMDANKLLNLN